MAQKVYTIHFKSQSETITAPPFITFRDVEKACEEVTKQDCSSAIIMYKDDDKNEWCNLDDSIPLNGLLEFKVIPQVRSDVEHYRFYHKVSSDEAYQLLMDKPNGTFLIRPSNEAPHLTVEYVLNFCVQKKKIVVESDKYRMHTSKKEWNSLNDLINSEKIFEAPLYRKEANVNNRKDDYEGQEDPYSFTPSQVPENPSRKSQEPMNHYSFSPQHSASSENIYGYSPQVKTRPNDSPVVAATWSSNPNERTKNPRLRSNRPHHPPPPSGILNKLSLKKQ